MKKPAKKFFHYIDSLAMAGATLTHNILNAVMTKPYISSSAAVVMDARTSEILYAKAAGRYMYPASTTKVMTALLLIEHAAAHGWHGTVAMSPNAVYAIGRGASNIGLLPGDTLTMRECLHAILLASANEVCVGVAEHIAGSTEGFAEMMNRRAQAAGACGSCFTNPHGLPDTHHITTALDIARIMRIAIKEPAFIEAISAVSREIFPRGQASRRIELTNKNLLIRRSPYQQDYIIGGKTGYTHAAKHTLVNYAAKNGAELICVAMHAPNYMTYPDTLRLFDYGFGMLCGEVGGVIKA